jgi:RNA polymerase sigma factor (sigma-70 family)
MNQTNIPKMFYRLPRLVARSHEDSNESQLIDPKIGFIEDPRLKKYLQQLIHDESVPVKVETIAQTLVSKLPLLPLERAQYQHSELDLSDCVTALLTHILFYQDRISIQRKILQRFYALQQHDYKIELADLYVMGLDILFNPAKLLKNFQQQNLDWYDNLRFYSREAFIGKIGDRLRSSQGDDLDRTNYGLLVRYSPKKALIATGERGQRLAQMLVLGRCLKETAIAKTFDTKNPQPAHYEALFARYREQEDGDISLIPNISTLKHFLDLMGNALRNYKRAGDDALARSCSSDDEDVARRVNEIEVINDLEELSSVESHVERQNLTQQVVELLQQLPPDRECLLMLIDGLQLTQAEVGLEMGCNQSTVKRQRDKISREVACQIAPQLSSGIKNSNELEEIVNYITCIYEDYYSKVLIEILIDISQNSNTTNLDNIDQICQEFATRIQTHWQFTFRPEQKGLAKAKAFVQLRSQL